MIESKAGRLAVVRGLVILSTALLDGCSSGRIYWSDMDYGAGWPGAPMVHPRIINGTGEAIVVEYESPITFLHDGSAVQFLSASAELGSGRFISVPVVIPAPPIPTNWPRVSARRIRRGDAPNADNLIFMTITPRHTGTITVKEDAGRLFFVAEERAESAR